MNISFTVNLWFIVMLWPSGIVVGMLLAVGKHR